MFILLSTTGAFARTSTNSYKNFGQQLSDVLRVPQKKGETQRVSKVVPDSTKVITVPEVAKKDGEMSPDSLFEFTDPVFNTDGTLDTSNPSDFYFFTATQNSTGVIKLASDNPDYVAVLYPMDWSTGTATATSLYVFAGADYRYAYNMPAGDYALYVFSNDGSVGQNYTIMWNNSNPANCDEILKISDNLTGCYAYYSSLHKIYLDGTDLASVAGWERRFSFTTEDGNITQDQNITDPVITGMSLGSYQTAVAPTNGDPSYPKYNIPHALFISIGPRSKWETYTDVYHNGGPFEDDPFDVRGLQTPRDIDVTDVSNFYYDYQDETHHYHCFCLVYDLDENSFLDFCSSLNGFYSSQSTANHEKVTYMNITRTLF